MEGLYHGKGPAALMPLVISLFLVKFSLRYILFGSQKEFELFALVLQTQISVILKSLLFSSKFLLYYFLLHFIIKPYLQYLLPYCILAASHLQVKHLFFSAILPRPWWWRMVYIMVPGSSFRCHGVWDPNPDRPIIYELWDLEQIAQSLLAFILSLINGR